MEKLRFKLLLIVLAAPMIAHADIKLMAVKDIIIAPGTLRTFVTDRQTVESQMPFINLDCALLGSDAGESNIPKGTALTVKSVSKPEKLDLATIKESDIELEYAFQFGTKVPSSLKNPVDFQKAISDEYIRFYGSPAIGETTSILRSTVDVQASDGRAFKIQCENKINGFETENIWDVLNISDSLKTLRVVEFVIKKGTHNQPWNMMENPIRAKVGDVIRFINEDDMTHQLHTYGAPCEHEWGSQGEIEPGTTWDCRAEKPWNSLNKDDGPLHNHLVGQEAKVWIVVTP